MNLQMEDETLLRWHLLGATSPEEDEQISERWPGSNAEALLLAEEDLIDDYARGTMPISERELFEQNFLTTPERRQKLLFARAALKQAAQYRAEESEKIETAHVAWWQAWFVPGWRVAVAALLVLLSGVSVWQWRRGDSKEKAVMLALNQAYREQRPVEARIAGQDYAPYRFSVQLGAADQQKVDYVALERAKATLFGSDSGAAEGQLLGRYYLLQKEFDKAIEQFQQALLREPNQARLHSDLGAAFLGRISRDRLTATGRRAEDVDVCLTHLNRALELDPTLREALFNRALLQQHERLRRQARADWQKYLQLDTASSWAEEARNNLKEVEAELQKVAERRRRLEQDFQAAIQAGDEARAVLAFSLSYSFNGNGIAEKLLDDFLAAQLAGNASEAAAKLNTLTYLGKLAAEKTQDSFLADLTRSYRQAARAQLVLLAQARQLMKDAYGLYQRSENDQAVAIYGQAKQLFVRLKDEAEALFAEAWIGHCHHQRADTAQNLPIFARLAPAFAAKRYRWMQANATCGLANGHEALGRLSQALEDASRCGELSAQVGDQIGVIRSLYMRCNFYRELGRHTEVLRLAQQGLELADKVAAETRYTISFYQTSARSLGSLGRFEAARAFQQEAILIAEESRSPRLTARAYIHLGLLYGNWKNYDAALANIQTGISIGQQLKADRTGQEFVHYGLLHLGNIYREAGRFQEALQVFKQVTEFFSLSGRQIYNYAGAKGRLLTLIAQGDLAGARLEVNQVIALYEKYRQRIEEESNRNSFFDQEQGIYDVAIDLAATGLQDAHQALWYSELSRSRSLLDVTRRGWQLVHGSQTPELKIGGKEEPVTPEIIRQQLPERVQLVEYAVLDDKVIIWVITNARTQWESRSIPISRAALTTKVRQFLAQVSQPPGKGDKRWQASAQELHDILIRPVKDLLDPQKQLCIVPDKILTLLPYGALVDGKMGRLLLEEYSLLYSSSANLFLSATNQARQKRNPANERLLVVGNPQFDRQAFPALPDLPTAEREARNIATLYANPLVLVGGQARKSAVLPALAQADVVHLTAHYVTDPWSPMLSKLPLAVEPGGTPEAALQMYELYRLGKLPPRLVVLAACQTRGEEYYSGEGAIGFSRPFEAAGVPLVVASLWPVDEQATSELMLAFHRARKQTGQPSVAALRAAQLAMAREQNKYQHPYYWAAFTVVGGYCEY